MLNLTGIPHENTEYLEILKYETGGHYERHHDMIATQGPERCGNRILTFYLFLSDVEEGGQLRFTEIEKDVQPKKGRAVLWQNVLNDNFEVMHTLTFHEAMPVERGQKYGANLWFHPRNMRDAMEHGCCA
jgi:prolyl 4-hydroxylase